MARHMHRSVWSVCLIAAVGLLVAGPGSAALPDTVRIDAGLVSGVAVSSDNLRVFKGIPFAAPPVGPLRWRPPQPPARWAGVRAAENFGSRCMQPEPPAGRAGAPAGVLPAMSEDCLYLNVITDAASATERRPVIVWSHGGALTIGTGSRDMGDVLARKGAVVVTYNYRLGPFGFFAHPELTKESGRQASGNYGLMDLVAVLRWVQRNIAAFGGDPNRVTLMGQSGGGRLTRAAVASPEAKGLVHRAISQSAPVRADPMWTRAEGEAVGQAEAAKIGAATLADLRARTADEIQAGIPTGRLMIDGWFVKEDVAITIAEGRHDPIDLLIGSNEDEATFVSLFPASPFVGLEKTTHRQYLDGVSRRFGAKAEAFLALYPAGTSDDTARASLRDAFRDEASWNAREWALAVARAGRGKAYLYYFVHDPPVAPGQPDRGATHGAEIPYAFNIAVPQWTDVDRALAGAMSSYWVNFATHGDPNGMGLPRWPALQPTARERMILGPTIAVGPGLAADRAAVFDALTIRRSGAAGASRP